MREQGVNHVRVGFIVPSDEFGERDESFHQFVEETLPLLDPEPLPRPHQPVVRASA
jgi:hypothetical protein